MFTAATAGIASGLTVYSPHFISENEQHPIAGYAALSAAYAGLFGGGLALARRSRRELPERFSLQDIALYGVGTHRLSRILSRERLGRIMRVSFTEVDEGAPAPPGELAEHPRDGGELRRAVGELVSCTLCLDQWVAGGFVLSHVIAPRVTRAAAAALAINAASNLLHLGYTRAAG